MIKEKILEILERESIPTENITITQTDDEINVELNDMYLPIVFIRDLFEYEFDEHINVDYNSELDEEEYNNSVQVARELLEEVKEEERIILVDDGNYIIQIDYYNDLEQTVLTAVLDDAIHSRYDNLYNEYMLAKYVRIARRIRLFHKF